MDHRISTALKMSDKKKGVRIFVYGFILSLLFFVVGFVTLSDYGINWDEARHYYKGQAILHFFLTGQTSYKTLTTPRRSLYQQDEYPLTTFIGHDPFCCHPTFNDTLAALANYIFFRKLGIVGDVESYHIFVLFVSSLLTGVVFVFTAIHYGYVSGVVAYLALSLFPFFLGESRFNIKDPVEMTFYTLALIAFYNGVVSKNWRWIILSSVATGAALGTKFNVFFAIIPILGWLLFMHWKQIRARKWPFSYQMTVTFLFYPIISFAILYAFWPLLWDKPIENFIKALSYYREVGYSYTYQPQYLTILGFNTYALRWIAATTPGITLILSAIGILFAIRFGFREKHKTSLFVLLWFIVPILRVTIIPKAGLFMGIRHIAEFIPAMAILCGIGTNYLIKKYRSYSWISLLIVFSFLPIMYRMYVLHPNQNVFYNTFVGGLKGAKEINLQDWGTTYGNGYRQAARWLNAHAELNSKVTLAVGYEGSVPRAWLRSDIRFSNEYRKNFLDQGGEYIVEMTSNMPSWPAFCYWVYVQKVLKPVHEIMVDDVAIMTIWKNDDAHVKPEYASNIPSSVLAGCVERNEYN